MFNVMQNGNAANDPEMLAYAYRMAVEGVPHAILYQAVKNITTGQAEGLSKIFFPTAPQFRQYCEELEKRARACMSQAQRLLDAPEEMARHKSLDATKMKLIASMDEKIQPTRH